MQKLVLAILVFLAICLVGCGGGGSDSPDRGPSADPGRREDLNGVAAADMNGDGLMDLVVGSATIQNDVVVQNRVAVHLQNNPSPTEFESARYFTFSETNEGIPFALRTIDLTGSGYPDLVSRDYREGGFRVMRNNPSDPGELELSAHYGPADDSGVQTLRPVLADIDLDGLVDVVQLEGAMVSWYSQDASAPGTFASGIDIGRGSNDLAVADINRDGAIDIVTLIETTDPEELRIYYNTPGSPGLFGAPVSRQLPYQVQRLVTGDFNGDSRMDIVVLELEPDPDISDIGVLRLFTQTSSGGFQRSTDNRIQDGYYSLKMGVSDLNANGRDNIAMLTGDSRDAPVMRVYEFDDNGEILVVASMPIPEDTSINSWGSTELVIEDVNQDFLPDIVVSTRQIWVFYQRPGRPGFFYNAVMIASP